LVCVTIQVQYKSCTGAILFSIIHTTLLQHLAWEHNQAFGKVAEAVSSSFLELKEVGRSDPIIDPFELAEAAGLNS
jgi:hypothetical protein